MARVTRMQQVTSETLYFSGRHCDLATFTRCPKTKRGRNKTALRGITPNRSPLFLKNVVFSWILVDAYLILSKLYSEFNRCSVDLLLTWEPYWNLCGYVGGHFVLCRCRFKQCCWTLAKSSLDTCGEMGLPSQLDWTNRLKSDVGFWQMLNL